MDTMDVDQNGGIRQLTIEDLDSINSEGFQESSMPDMLSNYNGSFTQKDQKILEMLKRFEAKKHSIIKSKIIVWGPAAQEHYSIKEDVNFSLSHQTKMEDVLILFDKEKINRTLICFPANLSLDPFIPATIEHDIYDPRFLLPLLYHLIPLHSLINCHRFIELKGLSLALISLSSNSNEVRALGYLILYRFYHHLESSTLYKDRLLWINFLDYIRSILKEENEQLPTITTMFFVRALEVMLHPTSQLYGFIKGFLTKAPKPDDAFILNPVLDLLSSRESPQYKQYQIWSLNFLADAIKLEIDYKLYKKLNIFNRLVSFYQSPLSDHQTKILILNVIESIVKIKNAAKSLCKKSSFLAWMLQEVNLIPEENSEEEKEKTAHLSKIVCLIWENCSLDSGSVYATFEKEYFNLIPSMLKSVFKTQCYRTLSSYLQVLVNVLELSDKRSSNEVYFKVLFPKEHLKILLKFVNNFPKEKNHVFSDSCVQRILEIFKKWILFISNAGEILDYEDLFFDVLLCILRNSTKEETISTITNLCENENMFEVILNRQNHDSKAKECIMLIVDGCSKLK